MFAAGGIKRARRKIKVSDAGILGGTLLVGITSDQCVVGVDLVIEPRADLRTAGGSLHYLGERDNIELRIQNDRINRIVVINFAPF